MFVLNDSSTAMSVAIRLLATGTLVASAELMSRRHLLRDTGLMSWPVGRLRKKWLVNGPAATVMNHTVSYPNILWLLAVRAAVAAFMIVGPPRMIATMWVISIALVLCWLTVLRTSYGLDGADQMAYVMYTGLAITIYAGTDRAKDMFLWFIALQACLSYCVAGIAKASASGWRDGSYLVGICYTRIYGQGEVARFLAQRPRLAKSVSRSIIVWEVLFPVVLFVPQPVAICILVSGAMFHLLNGVFMGLNTFIWSFVATYPAILYCIR